MRKVYSILILILILPLLVFAADHYNAGTVTVVDGYTYTLYKVSVTIPSGGDSTGSWHTPALFIGEMNADDGYIDVVCSATADVNVLYHYSNDKTNWVVQTADSDVDAVSSTVKADTLGSVNGSNDFYFHNNQYLVIEFDGQSGSASGITITANVRLKKNNALVTGNGQPINVGMKSNYNSSP